MQVGLAEMQTAVEQTGGLLVQASTFHAQAFKESFRRVFAPASDEGHLGMNSNAQFEVCLFMSAFVPCWSAWKAVLSLLIYDMSEYTSRQQKAFPALLCDTVTSPLSVVAVGYKVAYA